MNDHRTPEPVFAWLGGQRDNVGDSALRRAYADALRPLGPLVVWSGGPHGDYDPGLGLAPDDRVCRSFLAWTGALLARAVRGGAVLALNAGEYTLTHRYFLKSLLLLPVAAILRLRGGRVVWAGAAIPRARRGYGWLFRLYARMANVLLWRDSETADVLYPAATMPDWAFALAPEETPAEDAPIDATTRPYLVVSLRFDRPLPSREWAREVQAMADRLGLRLLLVTQVRRDDARAREVLGMLDHAELLTWGEPDHRARELRVRSVYRDARVVLSDRLHVLIMAATEGAVPLGWVEAATTKIDRHFGEVDLAWVATPSALASLAQLDDARLREMSAEVSASTAASRARLDDVTRLISEVHAR